MLSIKIFCRRRCVKQNNKTHAVRSVEGVIGYRRPMSVAIQTSFSSDYSTRPPFNRRDHVLILLPATFIFILPVIDEASLALQGSYQIA